MNRSQLYERALTIMNRLYELKEAHQWSAEETNLAFKVLDEHLPLSLHMAGAYDTH